ncbi:MAG: papain fold toxin domain-containing protein [Nostoc sp.]|uniref:papain fold toxin domain-containing protein n=1 Tax=Nostoc sp. TaxID=1180 RepID=UPI002FF8B77F
MRLTTKKSISRLVGIWTFLFLLIFKGVFPKPAYAFLSSLDACAANPECAAAIGSEVAPAVAAPTAEAAGTTAISTTTATGVTTSSVEVVAGTTVVGDMRLSGVAAFYIWNRAQNEQAQNKAKEKYCATYPNDSEVCTSWTFSGNGIWVGDCSKHPLTFLGNWISEPQFILVNFHTYCSGVGVLVDGQRFGGDGYAYFPGTEIKVRNNKKEWKDWPQEKRNAAVKLLNNSDWQGLISSMPAGGLLNPGDKINAPTIVIPGQETDDPNTPADEGLLRKESGFFTFPGIPDFDKDGIPDSIDLDNDNDGIVNTNDPEPYNPNVFFASSAPDQSGKVTPEVLQDIRDIVSKHPNEFCVECAAEIETYLREQGIHGERIKLDTTKSVKEDDNIYDDSHPPKAAPDYIISTNGHHEGIAIRINGEEKVFDNLHPDGVPTEQWINNLTFISKELSGAKFRRSGYLF